MKKTRLLTDIKRVALFAGGPRHREKKEIRLYRDTASRELSMPRVIACATEAHRKGMHGVYRVRDRLNIDTPVYDWYDLLRK